MTFSLISAVRRLRKHYGPLLGPPTSDPFELVLWENIAYLASPERKLLAFEKLRALVGTQPAQILAAHKRVLESVAAYGILKKVTAAKLQECARIAIKRFDGALGAVLIESNQDAIRKLQAFPSIGKPGAERVLLFANKLSTLAPESNAIRVLVRVGLLSQDKSYSRMYEAAGRLSRGLRKSPPFYQEAHLLLQTHGRTLCRIKNPECVKCPLRKGCDYAQGQSLSPFRQS